MTELHGLPVTTESQNKPQNISDLLSFPLLLQRAGLTFYNKKKHRSSIPSSDAQLIRQYAFRAALPLSICSHSLRSHVYISVLPDRTVPAVGISSRYSAHLCATRCILVDVHDIMIYRKHRGFVHVPDCDFKGGSVFERAEIGKTRIHMCIHPLNVEGVGLLSLVVQRLLGKGTMG